MYRNSSTSNQLDMSMYYMYESRVPGASSVSFPENEQMKNTRKRSAEKELESPSSTFLLTPTMTKRTQLPGIDESLNTPDVHGLLPLTAPEVEDFRTIVDPHEESFVLAPPPGFQARPLSGRPILRPRASSLIHEEPYVSMPRPPAPLNDAEQQRAKQNAAWNRIVSKTFGHLIHCSSDGPLKLRMKPLNPVRDVFAQDETNSTPSSCDVFGNGHDLLYSSNHVSSSSGPNQAAYSPLHVSSTPSTPLDQAPLSLSSSCLDAPRPRDSMCYLSGSAGRGSFPSFDF